ncbi:hypothetical protein BDR26DRAFT_863350 [Obelidium mucronatum]|nr:hypothetical protein BDR26DRAFT_863350 [Obelidium mucronatum]
MGVIVAFWITVSQLSSREIDSIVLKDSMLERHRPALRFALIIPFSRHETERVLLNLETSWLQHPPCDPSRNYSPLIDLVFYFHKNILEEQNGHLVGQLKTLVEKKHAPLKTCFGSVRFLNALLKDSEDEYPLGATHMFFRLFHRLSETPLLKNGHRQHQQHHQAFYYMEPDNVPCRKNWLDRLYEEASIPGDFWMRGSIMRDRNPMVGDWSFSDHINGNALYRADDADFIDFVKRVEKEMMEQDPDGTIYLRSYDVGLDLVRRNRTLVDWIEYTDLASKFQYTETVQNWYRTPVNATTLCMKHPSTYLVHGREVFL